MKTLHVQPLMVLALVSVLGTFLASSVGRAESDADSHPGPAFTTLDGTVTQIEGDTYTVQNESANAEDQRNTITTVKIVVGKDTKKLRGDKKPGDKIRAEVTRGWFANSTQ
jgi:hypothetical protein